MAADSLSAPQLWTKTVNIVKDRVVNRSFWEAMESAVGIAIEDDTLIVGMNPRIFNNAGHLTVSDHRNAIEIAAREIAGRPISLRVIEGDTPEDWVATKNREARVARMRQDTYQQRDREEAQAQSWDSLHDYIARSYSNTPHRSLPQSKARFMTEMLRAVSDTMDQLCPAHADETTERHLARIIEKVADGAGMPPSVVALELDRLRESTRKPSE